MISTWTTKQKYKWSLTFLNTRWWCHQVSKTEVQLHFQRDRTQQTDSLGNPKSHMIIIKVSVLHQVLIFQTGSIVDYNWLNDVLRHIQKYFSHIAATAHIIHSFLGFTSSRLELWSVLPKDRPTKKPQDPVQSNPGPLNYQSTTLPLSHAGPLVQIECFVDNIIIRLCWNVKSKGM